MAESAVGIASLALAGPPIIEPILHCVAYVIKVVNQYRQASDSREEHLIQLDTHLYQVQQFTAFLQDNFDSLDKDVRILCNRLLGVLESRLVEFVSVLSSLTDAGGNINRAKYAVRARNSILALQSELVAWEGSMNSVLFAMILAGQGSRSKLAVSRTTNAPPTRLDKLIELMNSCLTPTSNATLRLDAAEVEATNFTPIPFSQVSWRRGPTLSLLEKHISTASDEDVRDIADFLSRANSSIVNTLKCKGFWAHTLLFELPAAQTPPITLQQVLIESHATGPAHDLASRLSMMRKIASCILFIHTAQHVHKSIRTSNILLLDASLPSNLGEPFLIGFDLSRKSKQASEYTRTSNWWQAYYLPPDRQGDTGRAYTMLDDIYSLGVVFLELCLWQSFARWRKSPRSPSKEDWDPSSAIVDSSSQDLLAPKAMQKRFIELAQEHVPVVLGSTMSKLIQACLTCTEDESAFGERKDLEDADGIVVGMAYIKQVISVLDNLVL